MTRPYKAASSPSAAFDYEDFHNGPECEVELLPGPSHVWMRCSFCRVAFNLEGLSRKIDVEDSKTPRSELPDDPGN